MPKISKLCRHFTNFPPLSAYIQRWRSFWPVRRWSVSSAGDSFFLCRVIHLTRDLLMLKLTFSAPFTSCAKPVFVAVPTGIRIQTPRRLFGSPRFYSIKLFSHQGRSISDAMPSTDLFRYSPIELKNESDFDQIVTSDGLISVCGFGSLLSGSYCLFNWSFAQFIPN